MLILVLYLREKRDGDRGKYVCASIKWVLTVEATEKNTEAYFFLPSDNITVPCKHHYSFMERRTLNYKNTCQYDKIGQL